MTLLDVRVAAFAALLFFVLQANAQHIDPASDLPVIQTIQREFKAKNLSFDSVTKETWGQLDSPARKEISKRYLLLNANKKTTSVIEAKTELNNIASKADFNAFRTLQAKGVIDPLLLQRVGIDDAELKTTSTIDSENYGVLYYREHMARLNINHLMVVSPGTPDPQVPGNQLGQPNSLPPIKGRIPRSFNPNGFLEVVKIEYSDVSGSCTGTLLSPYVVLTAAHCVSGKQVDQVKIRLPIYSPNNNELCRKTMLESSQYEQCLEFHTSGVSKINVHDKYNPETFANDVAYVVLDAPRTDGTYAQVHFSEAIPKRVTMAGYGDNGLGSKHSLRMQYALEVGWHSGQSMTMQKGYISWLYSPKVGQSATCLGDSGGPIYDGDYDGGIDATQHSLFSITSQGSSAACENFRVRQTNLATKEIKHWMCNELRDVIADCGTS